MKLPRILTAIFCAAALPGILAADDTNIAEGRPVIASGATTGAPSLVTDGDATTVTAPTTAGVIGFYYQIDLGREVPLRQILLYSQINANPNRLSRVRMSVFSDNGGVPGVERWKHTIRPGGENNQQGSVDILTANLDPAGTFRGRFVRITNDGQTTNCPNVAEIEVYEAPAPEIGWFGPSAGNITKTGRPDLPAEALLSWRVSGHTSLSIDQGIGAVTGPTGSVTVSPTARTTYTLTATNGAGITTRTVTIGVDETEQPPALSEFLASNVGGIEDEEGRRHDWIEVFNPNPWTLNLHGFHLTDDAAALTKWRLPDLPVPPGGHAIVWASNDAGANAPLHIPHAPFALGTSGEYLALVARDGTTVLSRFPGTHPVPAVYPPQAPDHSYGLGGDGLEGYFQTPTPGAPNGPRFDGVVADPVFSAPRGFRTGTLALAITCPTPGATVRYTTNGSAPTATTGTVLAPGATINLTTTTVVRAAAFLAGWVPADPQAHTYLFPATQSTSGWLAPSIATNPLYAPQMADALRQVPSMSLSVGPVTINGANDSVGSIEWIDPSGGPGFGIPCGAKLFGGAFTNFAKKSYRVSFRGAYGAGKLRFPLFAGFARGLTPVEEFDQIELRNGSHDMVARGFYMSNIFTDATMLDMGSFAPHGRFVHLYLNGAYWGLYHLRERWSADMMAAYYGGRDDDYESINGNLNVGGWADPGLPYDGTDAGWSTMKSLARSGSSTWEKLDPWLDVPQYIDYMTMWMFGKSEDEYRTTGPAIPGHGYKFLLNDSDGYLYLAAYGGPGSDRTTRGAPGKSAGDGPGSLFSMLYKDGGTDYRMFLADRIHRSFVTPGGAMTPAACAARLQELCAAIDKAIIPECARWNYRTPANWATSRDGALNWFLGTPVNGVSSFTTPRATTVLTHYTTAGFYPSLTAPAASPPPGIVAADSPLTLTAGAGGGVIVHSLNGPDPRVPGVPAPNAPLVTAATPLRFRIPSGPSDGIVPAPIPGLMAHWPLDGDALDAGGVHHGTLTNGALPATPGRIGTGCVEFDGLNDHVAIGNPPQLQFTGQITMAAWVRPDAVTGLRNILNKGHDNTSTPNGEITLRINGGAYQCGWWAGSGGSVTISGPSTGAGSAAADIGTWHHIAGLWDGSTWRLYRDGVQIASAGSTTGAVPVPAVGWAIGARGNGAERFFDGQIDDVRVYSRGLSAAEIAAIMNGSSAVDTAAWAAPDFDDTAWTTGLNGIGFAPSGDPLAAGVAQSIAPLMQNVNASVYARLPFTLTTNERTATASLTLRVRADDGYAAWLNGTRVAGRNAPSPLTGTSAATAATADDTALAGETIDLTPALGQLRDGVNILAIQGLNAAAGDDDALVSGELQSFRGTPGLAPEASIFDPANPPLLVRNTIVRTRRWLAASRTWSALNEVFYQVGPHACPPGWLVCSELHFNPVGDDDAEFIELLNAGPGAVNLRGARFSQGITFSFPDNRDTLLAPGERVILVDSAISYQRVHGWDAAFTGIYTDNLSNAGERLTLVAADGSTVLLDFTWGTSGPWPREADGGGRSLVLVAPRQGVDMNNPANWRASTAAHGNPDTSDAMRFVGDPAADADGDGLTAWQEHALGTSDAIPTPPPALTVSPDNPVVVSFVHAAAADDAPVTVQASADLTAWNLPVTLTARTIMPDGRVRSSWQATAPSSRVFYRAAVPAP